MGLGLFLIITGLLWLSSCGHLSPKADLAAGRSEVLKTSRKHEVDRILAALNDVVGKRG
jgi:hypothetical protein